MLPYVNGGEDAEAMWQNMEDVLTGLGDDQFAAALLREDLTTRSAVRDFLSEKRVREKFPKTFHVLVTAPNVQWPADKALQESYSGTGDVPPPKEAWGQ